MSYDHFKKGLRQKHKFLLLKFHENIKHVGLTVGIQLLQPLTKLILT